MKSEQLSSPSVVSSEGGSIVPPAADCLSASLPYLTYHGGPVLGAVEVVPIHWGSAWKGAEQATLAVELHQFFDYLVTSPLLDMLGEYSTPSTRIGHGRRLPSVHISDSEPGSATPSGRQLTDEDVQDALQAWIAGKSIPAPTENSLYFLFLPPGVTSLGYYFQPSVEGTFDGYHGNAENLYYVIVPAIGTQSVYSGEPLDTLTAISSRELCAAVINPALDGWFDATDQEIGDVCHQRTVRLGGYLVHLGWSNEQKVCAFRPADLAATGTPKVDEVKGQKAQRFLQVPASKNGKSRRVSNTFQAT